MSVGRVHVQHINGKHRGHTNNGSNTQLESFHTSYHIGKISHVVYTIGKVTVKLHNRKSYTKLCNRLSYTEVTESGKYRK